MNHAIEHCRRGASILPRASNDAGAEPDVVLCAAGDIPMLETVAAAWWLRRLAPDLRVRVVNVVDLMRLFPAEYHPHGMTSAEFVELFTEDKPVVFAFHGYQRAIHEIVHGHPGVDRIHVRGFNEQGTTTTRSDVRPHGSAASFAAERSSHAAPVTVRRNFHSVKRASEQSCVAYEHWRTRLRSATGCGATKSQRRRYDGGARPRAHEARPGRNGEEVIDGADDAPPHAQYWLIQPEGGAI